MAVFCAAGASAQKVIRPNRLEAAVLSKLPQFVEWPTDGPGARSTLSICVGSPDPFGDDLSALVSGETLNGRSVVSRVVARPTDLDGCEVLFLPSLSGGAPHPLLQAAAALPILTVGDDQRFLDEGGMVGLRIVEARVRFDINLAAAQRAGLRISSQLLRLALSVRGAAS
jgi:hypothetical protein